MILNENYILNNGVDIPKLGLGTWLIDDAQVADVVREAVKIGYRHIDTAQAYENELGVGEGVRACGLAREEIFVTTKLRAEFKNYAEARNAIQESLDKLDIGYIDMMLIHSPQPWANFRNGEHYFEGNLAAWRALEEFHAAGKIRAIGVSNFEQIDLENILGNAEIKPVANQVLCHIANTPHALIDFCRGNGILVEAYSPVAHGEALKNPQIVAMAQKYGVSVAQLCVRYCLEIGTLPLPKTANFEHLKNNAAVDFAISTTDLEILKNLEKLDYGDANAFPCFEKA